MSRFAVRRRFAASRTFVRHVQQLELFDLQDEPTHVDGMQIPPWRGLPSWHRELDCQSAVMRARRSLYHRFDATARQLNIERIRSCRDTAAIARLVDRLSAARYPSGCLHDLDRVWTRAELGALLVEATNRRTLIANRAGQASRQGPEPGPGTSARRSARSSHPVAPRPGSRRGASC